MPIYNWNGFYIGGHIGGAFTGDNGFAGTSSDNNAQFLGGVQIGGDYQLAQNWVIGVEGQFSWLGNNNGVTFPGGFAYTSNQSGLGSATGRIGTLGVRVCSTSREATSIPITATL